MLAIRILEERPVPGGEKFSAVIGPAPGFRRFTRATLGGALLSLAWEVFRAPEGLPAPGRLGLAAALFALCLASAWLSGGAEELVCQGGALGFRRAGALFDRGRLVPLRELRSVGDPPPGGLGAWGGVRVRTAHGTWRVGARLAPGEAHWLADALRRHVGAAPIAAAVTGPGPQRAQAPQVLARLVRTRP